MGYFFKPQPSTRFFCGALSHFPFLGDDGLPKNLQAVAGSYAKPSGSMTLFMETTEIWV